MKGAQEGVKNVSSVELAVSLVSVLVSQLADLMTNDARDAIKIEAELYRALAANCSDKAKMVERFLKDEMITK